MGKFRIKQPKKPLNLRRTLQSLEQLLNGTAMVARLMYPPPVPEEDDLAKFTANSLLTELNKPKDASEEAAKAAARHRLLVVLYMFQMCVAGIIQFMNATIQRKKNPVPTVGEEAAKEAIPLTEEQMAKAKAILESDGYKYEIAEKKEEPK